MPDTDSKMMRQQQDKDTPQRIEPDETAARRDRRDSDASSGAAREAARRGETQGANEAMNAVFNDSRRPENSGDVAEATFKEDAATRGNASLVRKGRSLLGQ